MQTSDMAVEKDFIINVKAGEDDFKRELDVINKRLEQIEKNTDGIADDFDKAGKEAGDFSKQVSKVDKEASQLGKSIKSFGAIVAGAFATAQIARFIKESARLGDVQAKAEQKLLVALKGREDVQKRLIAQAQNLQKVTLFGDEQTVEAQSRLASLLNGEEEAIKRLIPLVQDFAAAKEIDLASAAELVGKSVGSSTNALSRYGIQIEGTVGSSERLESAIKSLNQQVGGQAAAAASVGAGAFQQFQNVVGDLQESFGVFLLRILTPIAQALTRFVLLFQSLPNFVRENAEAFRLLGVALLGLRLNVLISTIRALSVAFIAWTRSLFTSTAAIGGLNRALAVLNTIVRANPIGLLVTALAGAASAMAFFKNRTQEAKESVDDLGDSIERANIQAGALVFDQLIRQLSEGGKDVTFFSDQIQSLADNIEDLNQGQLLSLKAFLQDELRKAVKDAKDGFLGADNTVKELSKTIALIDDQLGSLNQTFNETSSEVSAAVGSVAFLQAKLQEIVEQIQNAPPDVKILSPLLDQATRVKEELEEIQAFLQILQEGGGIAGLVEFLPEEKISPFDINAVEDQSDELVGIVRRAAIRVAEIRAQNAERNKEIAEEEESDRLERISQIEQAQSGLFGFFTELQSRELQELQEKNRLGLISDQEYAKKKAELDQKQARTEKAQALFAIALNTARGITAALASIPPRPALAAFVAAQGAIQAALVASRPIPEPPSFFKGTEYVKRGSNKKGRDTIPAMLHEGERVIPSSINKDYREELNLIQRGKVKPGYLLDLYKTSITPVSHKELIREKKDIITNDPDFSKLIQSDYNNTSSINKRLGTMIQEQRKLNETLKSRVKYAL